MLTIIWRVGMSSKEDSRAGPNNFGAKVTKFGTEREQNPQEYRRVPYSHHSKEPLIERYKLLDTYRNPSSDSNKDLTNSHLHSHDESKNQFTSKMDLYTRTSLREVPSTNTEVDKLRAQHLNHKRILYPPKSQNTSTNTQTFHSKTLPFPTKSRTAPADTRTSRRNPQTPPPDTQTLLSNTLPYITTSQGTLPVTQTLHSNGLPFNSKPQTTFPDTLNFHRETETFLPETRIFYQKTETSSPDSEIYTPKHFNSIPSLSAVSKMSGLFTTIETKYSNLSEKSFLNYEINVANEAHQIPAPGLNFITKCRCQTKNDDYIIHRSGLIPANNGYCNLDREIHRLMCPLCGKRVKPDPWLSVGFYQCKFKITFQTNSAKMKDGPKIITGRANGNDLEFAKCFPPGGSKYLFLDVEVKATTDITFL